MDRSVILLILDGGHDVRWSFAELLRETRDMDPVRVRAAVRRLERQGVLHIHEEIVVASRPAAYLDELGMICI